MIPPGRDAGLRFGAEARDNQMPEATVDHELFRPM